MDTDDSEAYLATLNADSDSDNLKFMIAAQQGCVQTLTECLDKGYDVNSRDLMFDETALMRACRFGRMDAIKYLLSRGAHINAKTVGGTSALHVAVLFQHVKCVEFLLECSGIEKDIQDNKGNTPLMVAAERGFFPLVQLLLAHGCNPDITNTVGQTSLHCSMMPFQGIVGNWDGYACLRILVDHGADVNAVDNSGMSPAHCAVQRGNKWALHCLVCANCDLQKEYTGWSVNVRKEFGVTLPASPLTMAVYYLNAYMVSLLYRSGCDMSLSMLMLPYASKRPSLHYLILSAITTPRTLKDLSRLVIRAHIGLQVQKKVDTLNIPDSLKSFILLSDLQVPGQNTAKK